METTTRRPWESSPPASHHQTQTLPSIETLTRDVDNRSMDKTTPLSSTFSAPRDSGSWSAHSGSILTGSHPSHMPFLNQSTNPSPSGPYTSEGPNGHPATLSANHSAHPSNASAPGDRGSGDFDDSRRGSVDSRIHQGIKNMDLGPTSPYNASANVSQTSLVQGLARERGILTNGYRGPRSSAGSGGPMSPLWPRSGEIRSFPAGRVAPPIAQNPKQDIVLANAPIKGQPWAFPDSDHPGRPPSTFSRRNSFAESFTSSIYSDRARLPPGQHELPGDTHHHSLQHRQVESLRGDPESPNSTTPYSRTPELRVTHKLAERKRRSEMKDCFEQLRAKLPTNQNNKASKWETLARAIDYINSLESQVKAQRIDIDKYQHKIRDLELKETSQPRMQHGGSFASQNPLPQTQLSYGHSQPFSNGAADNSNDLPRTLPPIMNGGAMQGVQYGSDDRR